MTTKTSEGHWTDDRGAIESARALRKHGAALGESHYAYDEVMTAAVALERVVRENRRLNRSIAQFIEERDGRTKQAQDRITPELRELLDWDLRGSHAGSPEGDCLKRYGTEGLAGLGNCGLCLAEAAAKSIGMCLDCAAVESGTCVNHK